MKKYDKEYSTQYLPEMLYLSRCGVHPSYVKVINGVTTYKYEKTTRLFSLLVIFYDDNDNDKKGDNDEQEMDRNRETICD